MKDNIGFSLVLQGVATIITAIGVILIALVKQKVAQVEQKVAKVEKQADVISETVVQVEKQGNSVSLELKRTIMVHAEALAKAKPDDAGYRATADSARTSYEEALKSNAKL